MSEIRIYIYIVELKGNTKSPSMAIEKAKIKANMPCITIYNHSQS